jgi:hypothetical protein
MKEGKLDAADLTRVFNRHRQPPERSPVSKRELDLLTAQRSRPTPAPQLTPGGGLQQAVDRQVAARLELRIGTLKKRLEMQRGNARDAFNRAR